jgi:hypothetical protein
MFHWIPATWHWVVNEGGLRDLVSVITFGIFTPVVAWFGKRLAKKIDVIRDQLDTSTPGGLTDVMNAVQAQAGQAGSMGAAGSGPGGDSGAT